VNREPSSRPGLELGNDKKFKIFERKRLLDVSTMVKGGEYNYALLWDMAKV